MKTNTDGDSEMDGLVRLGMKDEALRLTRQRLKQTPMTAQALNEALDAIMTLEGKGGAWRKLVESAYERLPKRERPAIRFLLIAFRNACSNHEGVLELMPKRFTGECALVELAFVLEAAFELDRADLVKKLARRLPDAIGAAQHPIMRSRLLLCYGEVLARSQKWDEAVCMFELAQDDETFSQHAIQAIVEIHAARAMLALQRGFELIEEFNRRFDPECEVMLPGNDKVVQEQAVKKFQRLQRVIRRIMPEKRRMELGLSMNCDRLL